MEADEHEHRKLDFDKREVVLRANLAEADDDRCLWTSMRFLVSGPRHPRVGESVVLIDNEGAGCVGHVEELNGWQARVRIMPDQA
jgi:hypothetical protein